jgi:hypothetical protein
MEAVNKQEIDVLITSAGITIFQAASVAYTDSEYHPVLAKLQQKQDTFQSC